VDRHTEVLRRQVRLFDDRGEQLSLDSPQLPDLSDLGDVIDVQANANLRITWRFRISLSHRLSSLTVLPALSHPELTSLPELRLHMAFAKNNQRLDAVVPDGRPHVIRFPDANSRSSSSANGASALDFGSDRPDPNIAHCDITVLRGRTIVELMAPLLMIPAARDAFVTDQEAMTAEKDPHLSLQRREQLRHQLQEWFVQQTTLVTADGSEQIPRVTVDFLTLTPPTEATSAPDQNAASDQNTSPVIQIADDVSLHPAVVQLGVRCEFSSLAVPVQLRWRTPPALLDDLSVRVLSPGFGQSFAVSPTPKSEQPSESAFVIEIPVINVPMARMDSSGATTAFMEVTLEDVVTSQWIHPTSRAIVISLATLVAVGFWWRARRSVFGKTQAESGPAGTRVVSAVLLAAVLGCGYFLWHDRQRLYDLQTDRAEQLTANLLEQVYLASQLSNPERYADTVSELCEIELAEQMFLDSVVARSDRESQGQVIGIRDIQVETSDVTMDPAEPLAVVSTCRWIITAEVTHWGHSHLRIATFAGRLRLHYHDKWKIAAVELTQANTEAKSVPPSSPSGRGQPTGRSPRRQVRVAFE
ncbi:MAG: hypothetical protein KDA96_26595, partial [Planctomycetaceae bacterium]|nr:hypothetical protein [Planctomycetaceae bacterium]